jgi:Skp family chaperone for outer membrane proteins
MENNELLPNKFAATFGSTMGKSVALILALVIVGGVVAVAYAIHVKVDKLKDDYRREIAGLKSELKDAQSKLVAAQKELDDKKATVNAQTALTERLKQDNRTYKDKIASLESVSRENSYLVEQNKDLSSRYNARLAVDDLQKQKGYTVDKLKQTTSHPFVIEKMKGGGVSFNDGFPVWNVNLIFNTDSRKKDFDAGTRFTVYPSQCSVDETEGGNLQLTVN